MIGGRKVVGSAQLREGAGLLQHGSILLAGRQTTGAGRHPAAAGLRISRCRSRTRPDARPDRARWRRRWPSAAADRWGGAWERESPDPPTLLAEASRHEREVPLTGLDLESLTRAVPSPPPPVYIESVPPPSLDSGAPVMPWTARLVLAAALVGASAARPPLALGSARARQHRHRHRRSRPPLPVPTLMEGAAEHARPTTRSPTSSSSGSPDSGPAWSPPATAGSCPCSRRAGPGGIRSRWRSSWIRGPAGTTARRSPRATSLFTLAARPGSGRSRPGWRTSPGASPRVEAEGDRRVVFRFREVYAEQLYDATFHVAILPAHLLAASAGHGRGVGRRSSANPVGSGPYRWVRQAGGAVHRARRQPRLLSRRARRSSG